MGTTKEIRIKTKNLFAHEVNIGDVITYNKIYPNTITIENKTL